MKISTVRTPITLTTLTTHPHSHNSYIPPSKEIHASTSRSFSNPLFALVHDTGVSKTQMRAHLTSPTKVSTPRFIQDILTITNKRIEVAEYLAEKSAGIFHGHHIIQSAPLYILKQHTHIYAQFRRAHVDYGLSAYVLITTDNILIES